MRIENSVEIGGFFEGGGIRDIDERRTMYLISRFPLMPSVSSRLMSGLKLLGRQ